MYVVKSVDAFFNNKEFNFKNILGVNQARPFTKTPL